MSSETSQAFRIMRKTVHFELKVDCNRIVKMDFPVIRDGKEDVHSWDFAFVCSRDQWIKNPDDYYRRYTYHFSLTAKQTDTFKYERSFYTIRIAGENNQELVRPETNDLAEETYNQFSYDKEMSFLTNDYRNLWVNVTLQSHVIDSPAQKSLKWMLDEDTLSDVVIKTQGKDFPCHKVVLAISSEYFVKMFQVDMKEKEESVVNWVDRFEADVVQDFLQYVYTGHTPPNLANTALKLIEMANMLLMDDLKKLCAHQLKETINADNVGDILQLAAKNESKELQKVAINFIILTNMYEKSPAPWEKVEPEFLTNVVATMMKGIADRKMLI